MRPFIDGGYRAEVYLYGKPLMEIYFEEAYNMFCKSTWNSSIVTHLIKFNENNKYQKKRIKININEFINNSLACGFLKKIFTEFNEFVANNSNEVELNYGCNARIVNDGQDIEIEKDCIFLDYEACVENSDVFRPDTEINKSLLYKYKEYI